MWSHDFFVLHDVHSQCVYCQEESLPGFLSAIELSAWPHVVHFNLPHDWFETNLWRQKDYAKGGKNICGCRSLLGRVVYIFEVLL